MIKTKRQRRRRSHEAGEIEARVAATLAAAVLPMTAYAIQHALTGGGLALHPPQVYRALDRLQEQGQVIRVETLNAWYPRPAQDGPLAVCRGCGAIAALSVPGLGQVLAEAAGLIGFSVTSGLIEVTGRCSACRGADDMPV